MRSRSFGLAVTFVLLAVGSTVALRAQMQHQGQMHQGQMHGQPSAAMMNSTHEMMRNIDTMMTQAGTMMHDLSTMHAGMAGHQHDRMMSSMQGMFDQMRHLQGTMNEMMKDQTMAQNREAMKAFQDACQNLKQMTATFQTMAKNMGAVMKGMGHDTKK